MAQMNEKPGTDNFYAQNRDVPLGHRRVDDVHGPQADRRHVSRGAASFFSVGVALGFIIRLNLLSPGWLVDAQTYNELFTSTASS